MRRRAELKNITRNSNIIGIESRHPIDDKFVRSGLSDGFVYQTDYNFRATRTHALRRVTSERNTYHTMMAAKLLIPRKAISGMHTPRKIYCV